jgi:hypothetical protein
MRRLTFLHVALLICMLAGLAVLGGWLYVRLQPAEGNAYFFYVDDTSSLPEGTEVKFRGLPVGQVVRVTLDEAQSTQTGVPAFRVDFQVNPQGRRVFSLWSFHRVTLAREIPVVGPSVVMLTDEHMPGGKTPNDRPLRVVQPGDGLPGQLDEIGAGLRELIANANNAVRTLRGSLEARPDKLGDDRAANLALVLQRDTYPLDDADPSSASYLARPTRLAAVLGNLADAARSFGAAGESITNIARANGPMEHAFNNVSTLTGDLDDPNKPFLTAIEDLKKTTTDVRGDIDKFGSLADHIAPAVADGARNADEMLDTLKREPWRLVWKSTKDYPTASPGPAHPAASPASRRAHSPAPAHSP